MHLIGLFPETWTPRAGASAIGAAYLRGEALVRASGSVPVIDLDGPIMHDPSSMDVVMMGTIPTAALVAVFDQLAAGGGARVPMAVLRINSPGGSVAGMTDIRAAMERARGAGVKIVGLIAGTMASCAVAIGSWCDELIAVETAMVGSIGVAFPNVMDRSKMYEQMGVKSMGIARPARKAVQADPAAPKPAGSVDDLERICEEMYGALCTWIDEGRGVPKGTAAATDARMMLAAEAMTLGLVDRVVPDAASFLAELNKAPDNKQLPVVPGNGLRGAGLAGSSGMKGSMELKDITIEMLQTGRPDLVGKLSASRPASVHDLVNVIGNSVEAKAFAVDMTISGKTMEQALAAWGTERNKALEQSLADARAQIAELTKKLEDGKKLPGRGAAPIEPSGNAAGPTGGGQTYEGEVARIEAELRRGGADPIDAKAEAHARVSAEYPQLLLEHRRQLAARGGTSRAG